VPGRLEASNLDLDFDLDVVLDQFFPLNSSLGNACFKEVHGYV
jgi:hypothetical protein